MKISKWSVYKRIIWIILLILLVQIVLGVPFYKINTNLSSFIPDIFLLFWIFYKKRTWTNGLFMTKAKKIEKKTLNNTIVFYILVPFLINFTYIIFDRKGFDAEVLKYTSSFARDLSILGIINIIIMAPLCEEIFFRGFIFSKLNRIHKPVIAILLSSLFFSLLHGTFVQQSTVWVNGIAYAYFYYKTGNIRLSILAHFLNNLICLIPLVLFYFNIEGYFSPIGLVFDSVLQFIISYIVFHKYNNKIKEMTL